MSNRTYARMKKNWDTLSSKVLFWNLILFDWHLNVWVKLSTSCMLPNNFLKSCTFCSSLSQIINHNVAKTVVTSYHWNTGVMASHFNNVDARPKALFDCDWGWDSLQSEVFPVCHVAILIRSLGQAQPSPASQSAISPNFFRSKMISLGARGVEMST